MLPSNLKLTKFIYDKTLKNTKFKDSALVTKVRRKVRKR